MSIVKKHWCNPNLYYVDLEDPEYQADGLPNGWEFWKEDEDDRELHGWTGGSGYIRYVQVERSE